MISLDAEVVPGKSIGGISLGDNASDVIKSAAGKFSVDFLEFENFGVKYVCCKIEGGAISFSYNEDGKVVSLWCEPPYRGGGDRRFYPGITAGKLRRVSRKQEIIKGYLVVDDNYSVYYGMPDDIDDFDHFSDLDDDVVFSELYVGDLS